MGGEREIAARQRRRGRTFGRPEGMYCLAGVGDPFIGTHFLLNYDIIILLTPLPLLFPLGDIIGRKERPRQAIIEDPILFCIEIRNFDLLAYIEEETVNGVA